MNVCGQSYKFINYKWIKYCKHVENVCANILIDDDTVKHKENFVPHFKQGDAIFFDEYIVHSTEFRSQINENIKRHAIEMWFHPHCASKNEYSEPLLW